MLCFSYFRTLSLWSLFLVFGVLGLILATTPAWAQEQSLSSFLSRPGGQRLEVLPQLDEREPISLPEGLELRVELPVQDNQPVEESPVIPEKPQLAEKVLLLVPAKAAPADLEDWFRQYGQDYQVDPGVLQAIARCESGLNPGAMNGPYGGLYQFHPGTWSRNRAVMGLDPNPQLRLNPEEAIKTAAFKISRDGTGAWPVCQSL